MQKQNVAEYKAIREELERVRNCITSYVGFVVLGSGPAFGYLAAKAAEKQASLSMGFASILLGLLSSLILFLLSYKFTSHNRYAGYSKLLTHERFAPDIVIDEKIFFWEICLDRLRATDRDKDEFERLKNYCRQNRQCIPSIPDLKEMVEPCSGPNPHEDKGAGWKGWRLMFFMRGEDSGSWKLPLYLARIFAAVISAFVIFAIILALRDLKLDGYRFEHYAFMALVALQIILWTQFVRKLYRQMAGSETVEAFCRKFVPVRLELLRELDPNVGYNLIGVSISRKNEPPPAAAAAKAGS